MGKMSLTRDRIPDMNIKCLKICIVTKSAIWDHIPAALYRIETLASTS